MKYQLKEKLINAALAWFLSLSKLVLVRQEKMLRLWTEQEKRNRKWEEEKEDKDRLSRLKKTGDMENISLPFTLPHTESD